MSSSSLRIQMSTLASSTASSRFSLWCLLAALALPVLALPGSAQAACNEIFSAVFCTGADNNGYSAGSDNDLFVRVGSDFLPGLHTVDNVGLIGLDLNDRNYVELLDNGAIGTGAGVDDGIVAGNQNTIDNQGTIEADVDGIRVGNDNSIVNNELINVDGIGINAGSRNEVENRGTIESGGDGIRVVTGNTVTNYNSIDALGDGIAAGNSNDETLINLGTIDAGGDGIAAGNGNVIQNQGTIGFNDPVGNDGIHAGNDNTITNDDVINADFDGIEATNRNEVTNNGLITTTDNGNAGDGITVANDNTVLNNGILDADGNGIDAGNRNEITNNESIFADVNGIEAGNSNTIDNTGSIGTTLNRVGGDGIVAGDDNAITNSGEIVSSGDGIESGDGGQVVSSGDIDAGLNGIAVDDDNDVENSGEIVTDAVTGLDGIVAGDDNTLENSGSIDAHRDGISADDQNVITNSGQIAADRDGIAAGSSNTIEQSGDIGDSGGRVGDDGIEAENDNIIDVSSAIYATDAGVVVEDSNEIENSDLIDALADGISAGNQNLIDNEGTVVAGEDGIEAVDDNTINNDGSIDAGEDGIEVGDNNLITNEGTIEADDAGILASDENTITNDGGSITAGAGADTDDHGIHVTGSRNLIINEDGGVIDTSALGDDGIHADGDENVVVNSSNINAGEDGIEVANESTVNNTGTIEADDAGINGGNENILTNEAAGNISAGTNGIQAGNQNTVTNDGLIDNAGTIENGILVVDENFVTNTGTIESNEVGISVGADNTVSNSGQITTVSVDPGSDGIFASGDGNDVTNSGEIAAGGDGIDVMNSTTVTNTGTIDATGAGISGVDDNDIENTNLIEAGTFGIMVDGNQGGGGNTVLNSGTIEAGAHGILGVDNNTIDNQGTITNDPGTGLNGIIVADSNVVRNSGSIESRMDGISADSFNDILNTGTIDAGTDGIDVGISNTVDNQGTILAGEDGIEAGSNNTISNSGSIAADQHGIFVGSLNTISNSGSIAAGQNGIGVGDSNNVTNTGTILAGMDGIDASANNTIVNEGTIDADGYGIDAMSVANEITNRALVDGADAGVRLNGPNSLLNEATGVIQSVDAGIEFGAGGAVVENYGTISGSVLSLQGGSGGEEVTNYSGGLISGDVDFGDGSDILNLETSSTLANTLTDGGDGFDTVNLFGSGFGLYTGRFAGMEVLNKNESGTWTLSGGTFGTPSVVTATNVNAGRLNVNGYLDTNATINPDGTLGGTGTIDGSVLNAGGTISPGNSIGTLTVTGSYSESLPSTHEIEINAVGGTDLLNVLGTHTINEPGSKLLVRNQAGDYWRGGEVYRFVEAGAGRSGMFDPARHMVISDDGDDVKLFLDYEPTNIELTSIPLDFGALGMGGNLEIIGDYLDSLIPLNEICETDACFLGSELGLLDDAGVKNGLKQLSPEYFDSYLTVGLQQAREFGDVAHSRMGALRRGEAAMGNSRYGGSVGPTAAAGAMGMAGTLPGQPYAEGKINPWLRGFGGAGEKDARNSHIGYDWTDFGGALGIDFLVNDDLLLGLMGGYSQADVDYGHVGGDSDIGLAWGGIYATYFKKNWYVDGLFGYGRNFFDSKRKISIGEFDATANSDPEGNNYTVAVDGGYNFQLNRGWGIEPNLRLSWARVDVDSFSESIGGGAGLDIDSITQDSLQTELGVRITKIFRSGDDVVWLPELRVGWVHEYLDNDRRISAGFGGSAGSMKIYGDDPGKDGASVRTGMTVFINEMVSVYGFYTGDFKSDRMYNGGTAGVRLRF